MIAAREEDSQKLMMDAAMKLVAREGFEGFTTKKWAGQAGVAEGSLYYHFKSKDDLLEKTFVMIDKGIAAQFEEFARNVQVPIDIDRLMQELWDTYYQYLLEHADATLYYYRFRTSTRYTQEVQEGQLEYFKGFLSVINMLNSEVGLFDQFSWEIFWIYLIDTTLAFAFRVITKGFEDTPDHRKQMYILFSRGVIGATQIAQNHKGQNHT
jgi:AcrR family transcriptional regulator